MAKIRWSDEERDTLLEEVKRQHIQHPHNSTLDLVRQAQRLALPSDRRRVLTGTDQVAWVEKRRQVWIKELAAAPVVLPPVVRVEVPPPPTPVPEKTTLKDVLSDLLSEMLAEVWQETLVKFKQQVAEVQQPVERRAQGPRLKRVFVYGLRQDVAAEVTKRLSGLFEFRCLDHSSPASIRAACDWADYIYVMIDFIGHSDQEIIKKNRKNVFLTRGTQSSLIRELEEKYLEQ